MDSSFLIPRERTHDGVIASLHLSRDQQVPVKLSTTASRIEDEGYAEGVVTNTRFGSFPHSTLLDIPWGSQVLASKVDTGTRGRRDVLKGKKRKAHEISNGSPVDSVESQSRREAVAATSGFIHILPPTPENWTTSLPHRTQVVYTPDYSYILHRIQARPGSRLIEAGSGSGSFTHAAARAVFKPLNGRDKAKQTGKVEHTGKVYTYEFHHERFEKVQRELIEHGLSSLVTATHRDVYKDGFTLADEGLEQQSPSASAIFLDLPAPWEALPHLTRGKSHGVSSALDPDKSVHICTFSPCIEQVQKTVSALRRYGWLDIEAVEIQHKRIDVRREYTGLEYEGMRSVNAVAATVHEALLKLREVEQRSRDFHARTQGALNGGKSVTEQSEQQDVSKVLFKSGRLIHRTEPELKTHTSYLVFAILPREWTDENENDALSKARHETGAETSSTRSPKHFKKEAKQRKRFSNGG